MANLIDLRKRLQFFGIDGPTRKAVRGVQPIVLANIGTIADKFYEYTKNFPESRRILAPHYSANTLRNKQVKHWEKLFSCRFDEEFVNYAVRIGQAHYKKRVYPYLYIGGYNFIQSALTELVMKHYQYDESKTAALIGINRVISLDIDLALSAYTREHWLQDQADGEAIRAPEMTASRSKDVAGSIFFIC